MIPLQPAVMRSPRSVDIDITARCNLRCTYCYYFDNPAVPYRDLPTEEWLTFFEECGRLGVMELTLAGGEPFMRPDLKTLLQAIVRNRMRFSLLSNGALIDDEWAAFIADTGRCNHVQVSVDGSRPETHDACRGKGSFERAVEGIRTLQRYSVPVAVRVTIHRHNVDDLEGIARLLLQELGLPGFGTNAAGYLGACRHNAGDVLLSVVDRQQAMATLLHLAEQYDGRISASAGPLSDARMWRQMGQAQARRALPFSNGGRLTGCGCPSNKIAARADGAMVVCSMLPHTVLGWINRDSLLEVWGQHPMLNQMRRRHLIPLTNFEFCADCEYAPYCTGNCPGLSYSLTGAVDHPSPDACLRRFLADGGILAGIALPSAESHVTEATG
jgi:Fe-coproporphyrin III synthase